MSAKPFDPRSYVGPPQFFDIAGAHQFCVLFHEGLRARHRVLDVGCGALRLGRLLIPWLDEGNYFGIEPRDDLLPAGAPGDLNEFFYEVERAGADPPNYTQFEQKFDFIMFHSIFTHARIDLVGEMLRAAKEVLAPDGKILATYLPGWTKAKAARDRWTYPECVGHQTSDLGRAFRDAGLRMAMPCGDVYRHFHGHTWIRGEHE